MYSTKKTTPRGIRNNNPINIRVGNNWKGEVEHPTDHFFEQFTEMKWGVRAAFIVLRNYICRHRCNTPRLIIERWAPRSENHTEKYLEVVCKRARLKPDDEIRFESAAAMCNLFQAMCYVENGCEISLDDVVAGYLMAGGGLNKKLKN